MRSRRPGHYRRAGRLQRHRLDDHAAKARRAEAARFLQLPVRATAARPEDAARPAGVGARPTRDSLCRLVCRCGRGLLARGGNRQGEGRRFHAGAAGACGERHPARSLAPDVALRIEHDLSRDARDGCTVPRHARHGLGRDGGVQRRCGAGFRDDQDTRPRRVGGAAHDDRRPAGGDPVGLRLQFSPRQIQAACDRARKLRELARRSHRVGVEVNQG